MANEHFISLNETEIRILVKYHMSQLTRYEYAFRINTPSKERAKYLNQMLVEKEIIDGQ